MDGWIKFHRRTLENPIACKDADYLAVWIYLLANATHADIQKTFAGNKVTLKPGQLITGRKKIAGFLAGSDKKTNKESKVTRILKAFENEQQIEQQTCNQNRLITILKWELYQSREQQIEQPVNNERTTSEQPVNTNKNERNKECKKENIKDIVSVATDADLKFQPDSFEIQCVDKIIKSCLEGFPDSKVPNILKDKQEWATEIDRMVRIDKRDKNIIPQVLEFALNDSFWKGNIRSSGKFRKQFETLWVQMNTRKTASKPANRNKFNNFPQREYDFNNLETQLLNK